MLPSRTERAAGSLSPRPAEAELASPEAARAMMSAFQRGWQRGRTDPAPETPAPATDQAGGDAGDHDEN